jgi:mRNA-degrading endonuclease RelE of RelBE toxin-antitoxin system
MSYRVTIKNSANADLKKLKGPYLKDRFLEIVETLKEDPFFNYHLAGPRRHRGETARLRERPFHSRH